MERASPAFAFAVQQSTELLCSALLVMCYVCVCVGLQMDGVSLLLLLLYIQTFLLLLYSTV